MHVAFASHIPSLQIIIYEYNNNTRPNSIITEIATWTIEVKINVNSIKVKHTRSSLEGVICKLSVTIQLFNNFIIT